MSIFNSLGSNYPAGFVWRNLFAIGSRKAAAALAAELGKYYGGTAHLTYKGREALELALRLSGLPAGSAVGINGFTCYVVYQAVENAGLKPVFIDTAPRQLDFGLEQLQQAHATHHLSAVIIQNTLGLPSDADAITAYCRAQKLLVIEDLAHSFGAHYDNGSEAGTIGDMTMLSFSQDKPLDVVAGGALIDRRQQAAAAPARKLVSVWQRGINRMYPLFTAVIRSTYTFGLGKVVHFVLKRLHLLATPMSDALHGLHRMSQATAGLVLARWQQRDTEIKHRREIAAVYEKGLPASMRPFAVRGTPTYLRYPIWVEQRESLILYLRKQGIYIGDTWYDAPIAPKRYMAKTSYQTGQCPEAEAAAQHIVNLPTHIHVGVADAQRIAAMIQAWAKEGAA